MPKYYYSVIRFVPSPVRGEFVNLGLIVGCDATAEWAMELVGRKTRAARLDSAGILPLVTSELERLQLSFPADSDDAVSTTAQAISESWLTHMAAESRNVLQYTRPQPIVAASVAAAMDRLRGIFIVEHVPQRRESLTRPAIRSRYLQLLQQCQLTPQQCPSKARLATGHSSTAVDVAVCNGVARRLTQCWSFEVQDTENVLNEVKAWGWTMRDLRRYGGSIVAASRSISVPRDVELSVIYALPAASDRDTVISEAMDVFSNDELGAATVRWQDVEQHARSAAALLHLD